MNRLFIETSMPNAFVAKVAVHQSRSIEEVEKDWHAAQTAAKAMCAESDDQEQLITCTVAAFKEIASSHGRPCEAIVDQEWTNRMRSADDAMWADVLEPLRSGRTPWTMVEDNVPRGRETAWWVHPHSGEVIATNAHALAVANQPEKFGLTREKATKLGATNGFNYYDTKAGSPRDALIRAAASHGWVRVRKISGGSHSFSVQAHGDSLNAASAALHHLEKRGVKVAGSAMVEDPAHGERVTLPIARLHAQAKAHAMSPDTAVRAIVRAHRVGKVDDTTPDEAPHFSAYERGIAAIASEPVVTERMQTTNFRGAEYDHEIERFQPRAAIEGHPAKPADRAGFLAHIHSVFAGSAPLDKYGTKPPHIENRASAAYLAHQMAYDNDAAAAVGHLGFQEHDAAGKPVVNAHGKPKPDLHAFHRHLMDLVDLHWPQPTAMREELARTGPVRLVGHMASRGVDMDYDVARRLALVRDDVRAAVDDPDYGHIYWNPDTKAVHWVIGDSAGLKGAPYGKSNPCPFIKAALEKHGFSNHRIEAEWAPKEDKGYYRVDRPLREEAQIRWELALVEDTLKPTPEHAAPHTEDGTPVHANRPVTLHLFRRTEKAPYFGSTYGQDVEPHGAYWTHLTPEQADKHVAAAGYKPQDYQRETATFHRPLLVHVADDSKTIGWKRDLATSYGKSGRALSKHLAGSGHDAIITHRDGHLGEIVDLRGFNPVKLPVTEGVENGHDKPFDVAQKVQVGVYDGCTVYIVNGAEVRQQCVDFIGGGNAMAYPGMPAKEIWVEQLGLGATSADIAAILVHELIEYTRMKYAKEAYLVAHNHANEAEACIRALSVVPHETAGPRYTDPHNRTYTEAELRYQFDRVKSPSYVTTYADWKARHFTPLAEGFRRRSNLTEAYGIPSSESGAEPCETGPATAADIAKVDAVVNDKSLPDVADPGKAYVVHWADGRGVCAFKRKDQLHPWLAKTGDWAEIISIKHKEPIHGKTKLRVHEDAGPYISGPVAPQADLTPSGDLDSDPGVVDKDDLATRIRKRMQTMKQSNISTTPAAPAPSGDNAPPVYGGNNTGQSLQMPPDLR